MRAWGRSGGIGRIVRYAVFAVVVLVASPYVIVPFYRAVDPVSTLMLWRWMTGARVERTWMPIAKIAHVLPLAVVVAEDGRFCSHHGVDLRETWKAFSEADDLEDARGGSTITQQVAKNLFLWPSHSIVRKVLELPLALWIDLVLPKRRILEIYLNIVEWGPNGEFGAEAAAHRNFGHSAGTMKASEAALMASTLPNPHRRDARKPGPGLRRLAGIHLRRMGLMAHNADCAIRR
jgi:monofunctional biosynthetic peptidoglycan transglycosylase